MNRSGSRKLDYYLGTLIKQWEMLFYRVDAMFGDDTSVVMFGECSYNFRANGENVTTPIAKTSGPSGMAKRCVASRSSTAPMS